MTAEKKAITVAEAGRKGGKTTSERYGHEFYEAIGQKGGTIGGNTTSRRYGQEFYREIGKKGGQKVRELIAEAKLARGNG